jgi:branched-chain amino acid transport system permease protein
MRLFRTGAYLSGVLTASHACNPWLGMAIAAAVVGLLAFAIGFPILNLKGHYLAMATLGFGIIVYIVFNEYVDVTGGPSGMPRIPNHASVLVFDSDLKNYYWSGP